jgi:hypothetical protein
VTPNPYPPQRGMTTLEREFVRAVQEDAPPPKARRARQRVTLGALPGRNRRQKRANAKAAMRAYLADKRARS